MLNRKTLISLSVHANAKVFLGTSKQKQLTKQLLVLWSRLFAYYISKICFKFKSCQYFLFGSSEFIVSIGGKKWSIRLNDTLSLYAKHICNKRNSINQRKNPFWTDKYQGDDYLCEWWLFHKIDTYKSYEMSFSIFIRMLSYFGHYSCYKIVKYFHFPKQIHSHAIKSTKSRW